MKQRKQEMYVIAALGSLLFHLLAIVVAVLIVAFSASANLSQVKEPEQITLTITETSAPTPTPPPISKPKQPAAPPPAFARTTKEQETSEAPDQMDFESDRNTKAATQKEAHPDGLAGLPTIEAKKREWLELVKQQYDPTNLGAAAPSMASQPSKPEPPKPLTEEKRPATPTPKTTPSPTPEPKRSPSPRPTATPTPEPDALAMLNKPTPPTPKPEPPRELTKPLLPSNGRPTETEPSEVKGVISLKGKTASVNANATPLGKYKARIASVIEERWRYYMKGHADLMTFGAVKLKFYVTPEGKVQNLQMLGNTSNESFASYTVRAITEAKLPPIPQDVRAVLDRGRMEVEYSFVLIAQ